MNQQDDYRILIIDDNPAIHQDFIKILTRGRSKSDKLHELDKQLFNEEVESDNLPKFQIDTASQGEEGVQYIKKALEERNAYSLAFVDIRMPPGWDGVETIKHIWKIDPDIQIVICTAYSDYSWDETVAELGMSDNLLILKKPFDNVAVRQLACALTKKWQLLRESKKHTEFLEQRVQERTISLEKSLSMMRATLESSTDGILVVDNKENIVDYNTKFVELWNIPNSIIEAKNNKILTEYLLEHLQKPDEYLFKIKELKKNPDDISINILKTKSGKTFECYSQPHKLKNKNVGRVWSFRDVTKKIHLQEKLSYQATHDPLTDLPNRILLMDRLEQAIAEADRNQSLMALLFFDLDRFKLINDSLSHDIGDKLLKEVSKRLQSLIRSNDTLARLGGDEFIIIVQNIKKESDVFHLANKFLNTFKKTFHIEKNDVNITSSVGISLYPKDARSPTELLRTADIAMYRAKESGFNKMHFYTQELNIDSKKRYEQESELRRAIKNKEFFLVYQPQFDLETKELIGVEALIRWKHPEKGVILPLSFIPMAEESGLILNIGEWVIKKACQENKKWQDQGLPKIHIAVNVTSPQFRQVDFVDRVSHILHETGLSPDYLALELTENVIITHSEVIDVISQLKEMGIKIVLDDFGTGNSSISHLRKIPLDRIKIDKTFVQNIENDRNDEFIIRAIISLADSLNLEVLAEGVENKQQLDFLKKEHCKEFQGFYLSKPLSEKKLKDILKQYKK